MSGTLKPYPKYKESGVEWLGAVPEEWEVVPLKRSAEVVMGQSPQGQIDDDIDVSEESLRFLQGCSEFGMRIPVSTKIVSEAPKTAEEDDILLSVRAPVGRLNIADRKYGIGRGLCAIRGNGSQFFWWWLLHAARPELSSHSTGSTYDAVSVADVESLLIPLPPLPEQQAIAGYLDAETQRIDTLIAELREMIGLLKEKRQALISHCVTKGLDPTVPMKDSGVEWLGEVPEGWEVVPLQGLVDPGAPIVYGIILPGPDFENGIPIIKGGQVGKDELSIGDLSRTDPKIEEQYIRSRLHEGDLLVSIRGSFGEIMMISKELDGANITQDSARIRPRPTVDGRWLFWTLCSEAVQRQFEHVSTGATIRGINIGSLRKIRLPLPPTSVAEKIAAHLDRETAKIDRLISETEGTISLMQERRSALISSVVTGKLQVPGVSQPSGSTTSSHRDNPR